MTVRSASLADEEAVWAILEPIIRAGEVFAVPRDMSRGTALAFWSASGTASVFVAEIEGQIVGTSYVKANQLGGGSHVANAGYAVAQGWEGKGIARTLCLESLSYARSQGFRAMQFNFVVSTNARAVELWKGCGFEIIGTLAGAFDHPVLGFVDAFVMFRSLMD